MTRTLAIVAIASIASIAGCAQNVGSTGSPLLERFEGEHGRYVEVFEDERLGDITLAYFDGQQEHFVTVEGPLFDDDGHATDAARDIRTITDLIDDELMQQLIDFERVPEGATHASGPRSLVWRIVVIAGFQSELDAIQPRWQPCVAAAPGQCMR